MKHPSGAYDQIFVTVRQMSVSVVRNEKLVAEAGDSSGIQRKGNVRLESRYQATASED
jgi:hypothetical protein